MDLKPSKMDTQGHDYDDSKIDADLDKLLQHIKEEQQNSMVTSGAMFALKLAINNNKKNKNHNVTR